MGPGGPPCAPPYVRRVRIYAHGTFCFTPRLIYPFFVTHPPANLSSLLFFSLPNDLFSVWFPLLLYTCVVLVNFRLSHLLRTFILDLKVHVMFSTPTLLIGRRLPSLLIR
jgi:hypothetical protein